jgi:hypothetical protein
MCLVVPSTALLWGRILILINVCEHIIVLNALRSFISKIIFVIRAVVLLGVVIHRSNNLSGLLYNFIVIDAIAVVRNGLIATTAREK